MNPQIKWVPPGKPRTYPGWINGSARGLEVVLKKEGHDVDFDTIMGDLGVAFLAEAEGDYKNTKRDDLSTPILEPLAILRLTFLEHVVGREIGDVVTSTASPMRDPMGTYKALYEQKIASSIANGRPCLVDIGLSQFVVTGYDQQRDFPLLGMCPNIVEGEEEVIRIQQPMPPFFMFVPGRPIQAIDRKEADMLGLRYAIHLHHDQVIGANSEYSKEYPLRHADAFGKQRKTGLQAFQALSEALQTDGVLDKPRRYTDATYHIERGRVCAVRYLTAIQQRHPGPSSPHLENAIEKYKLVSDYVRNDTKDLPLDSPKSRSTFANLFEKISQLEKEAISEIEKALSLLQK